MKRFLRFIFHIDHIAVCISTFALFWLLKVVTFNLDILNPVAEALDKFSTSDIFFDIQYSESEHKSSDLITIVDMTELHSRGDIAMMLEEINLNDPLLVGVDLIFEGVKDDSSGNAMLEMAVAQLSDVAVFSNKLIDYDPQHDAFIGSVGSYFAQDMGVTEAYTNLKSNMSGEIVREFTTKQLCGESQVLSFPARLAAQFDDSLYESQNRDLLIDYSNVSFPVVRWDEIAENSDLIEGHIVLVGTMTEERDMHMTPVGKMPGLKVQAYSLLTLLEHKNITELPQWLTLLLCFMVCYLLELILSLLHCLLEKYPNSVAFTFLKESELLSLVAMFVFTVFLYWASYSVFVNQGVLFESAILIVLVTLLFESRVLYRALVFSLRRRYNWEYLNHSLFRDDK